MPRPFYNPENYADELSSFNSELGYALFHPGMGTEAPITVGDIGKIEDGRFIRFFNAFKQAGDDINNTHIGTPPNFEPVSVANQYVREDDSSYQPGVFGSRGVKKQKLDMAVVFPGAAGRNISTRFQISFSKESNVALMTKWKAKATNAAYLRPLAEYFLRNYQGFLNHIGDVHNSPNAVRPDELVFVTGTVMTGDWVMARASTGSENFQLGFDCGDSLVNGGARVYWNYFSEYTTILPSREGPDRPLDFNHSQLPEPLDQCIFLKRLRVFDKSFLSLLKQRLSLPTAESEQETHQQLRTKKIVDDKNKSILIPAASTVTGRRARFPVEDTFEKSVADPVLIQGFDRDRPMQRDAGLTETDSEQQEVRTTRITGDKTKSIPIPVTGTVVGRKTNLLVEYIFEKSDADVVLIQEDDIYKAMLDGAGDSREDLEIAFENGSIFIEILSEISEEIGKKVAAILTRPLPLSPPSREQNVVVDDTLTEILGSQVHDDKGFVRGPASAKAPTLEDNNPRFKSESAMPPPSEAGPHSTTVVNTSNVTIYEGDRIVNNVTMREHTGIDRLMEGTSPGAFHNSSERYDSPKCQPGTRRAVLEAIMSWIEDGQRKSFIMWLYGPAGGGKTAIAQIIAELCHESEILAASFFWSLNAPTRNDEKRLIASLAFQLVIAFPQMRPHVERTLEINPLLLSLSLETQMESIIVEPLKKALLPSGEEAGALARVRSKLIILDGLDECGNPNTQRYILDIISRAVQRFPIPISFLVTSRPEEGIRTTFNSEPLLSITSRIALDDKYHPNVDIRLFFIERFDSLKRSHAFGSHLPSIWPTTEQVDALVQKSSGQFIYAATVVKFISSSRHRPDRQLNIVLGTAEAGNQTPFAELDALYRQIFSLVDDEDLPRALEVISYLFLVKGTGLTPKTVEDILSYEHGELRLILRNLHSLVYVPDNDDTEELYLYHASLRDFLTDPARAGPLQIDEDKARTRLNLKAAGDTSE